MSKIVTLSAYGTTAERFFQTLIEDEVNLVLDVRLRNTSQLCGFSKKRDLAFLVPQIARARYISDEGFAPTPDLLDSYLKQRIGWDEYATAYRDLIGSRGGRQRFESLYGSYQTVCLLGTATKKRRSHAEALRDLLA